MTKFILENIKSLDDLIFLSEAYKKGLIKLKISDIAKHLGKDRKTVRKYLNGFVPKKTKTRKKYLDDFRDKIIEVLDDKHQIFDYKDHLYKYCKRELDIKCSRSTFIRYIDNDKELSRKLKKKNDNTFTVRFETEPGQQVQFDMKENLKLIDACGNETIVNIATLTFGYSRYNMRKLIIDKDTQTLITFLAECFDLIGGVPQEIVIDNLKQFVTKSRHNYNDAILNQKFEQFCNDYGIKVKPCMPRRPQTKGKTETQNKIVDQMKNYNGKYQDISEMHSILELINKEDNVSISQATNLPRDFLFQKEKGKLQPLPRKEIRSKYYLHFDEVIVSNESLVVYKTRKYSVPKTFIGLKVGLTVIDDKLHIYYSNKIVAVHTITNNLLNIKDEHKLFYLSKNENKTEENAKSIIHNELENINYD